MRSNTIVHQCMTSRRYQSQFFNFVTRQTQKLADQSATLLRHAKTTVIWTTQIVLYPIYAAFQGTRAIGQQIGQTVEKAVLRLRMSREEIAIDPDTNLSDAPIQNVLIAVKRALVSGGTLPALRERHPLVVIGHFLMRRDEDLVASNPYQIQAIACEVTTHKLVLILEGNVIFDILTPEQQRQIEHRIRLELARYGQWRRKLYLKSAPLALPDDRETLLPPIRVFRQLMAWIQASPVAIALNLFQESELVAQPGELDWFIPTVPLSAWNPGTLIPKPPSPRNITAWFAQLPNFSDLEALIWAAVHYFFGDRTRFAHAQGALSESAVGSAPGLGFTQLFRRNSGQNGSIQSAQDSLILEGTSVGFEGDRSFSFTPSLGQQLREWLRKLRGAIVIQRKTTIVQSNSDTAVQSRFDEFEDARSFSFTSSLRQRIRESLRKLSGGIVIQRKTTIVQSSSEIVTQTRSEGVSTHVESAGMTATWTNSPAEISTTRLSVPTVRDPEPSQVETAFDWIETPATHVEYVLTPWQTFLKWLDSGVLWIEQRMIALWRWFRRGN